MPACRTGSAKPTARRSRRACLRRTYGHDVGWPGAGLAWGSFVSRQTRRTGVARAPARQSVPRIPAAARETVLEVSCGGAGRRPLACRDAGAGPTRLDRVPEVRAAAGAFPITVSQRRCNARGAGTGRATGMRRRRSRTGGFQNAANEEAEGWRHAPGAGLDDGCVAGLAGCAEEGDEP